MRTTRIAPFGVRIDNPVSPGLMISSRQRLVTFGLTIGFALLLWTGNEIFAQGGSHVASSKSVVSISATGSGGTSVGSGFVWKKSYYVVTALHVVAGAKQIEVYSETKKAGTGADLVAVIKEADLALLKLKEDLGLSPLQETAVSPNSTAEFYIWGYPHDVAKMQGDFIRFSLSQSQTPTMKSIFKNASQFKKIVGNQGYPTIRTKILRISTTIQPGHSGAPIFDKSGKVVGIGDGGLRQGIARINWAIPAAVYLPGLENSGDTPPSSTSRQTRLFGKHIEKQVKVPAAGSSVLEKVWSASLEEVLSTADPELAEIFAGLNQEALEETGRSLESAWVDVYEDSQTGATIAVPKDFPVQYHPDTRLLITKYPGAGNLMMIIQIVMNDTYEKGKVALNGYAQALHGLANWVTDPEIPDEEDFDPEESSLLISRFRYVPDENDDAIAEMNLTLVIDQDDFLGAAVVARNMPAFDEDAWYQLYVMHVCSELADFSIE